MDFTDYFDFNLRNYNRINGILLRRSSQERQTYDVFASSVYVAVHSDCNTAFRRRMERRFNINFAFYGPNDDDEESFEASIEDMQNDGWFSYTHDGVILFDRNTTAGCA